jgi:carnosine N-methyltransferase
MLKHFRIPDVLPSDLPPGCNFSLVAGDFEEVYGQQNGEPDPNEPSAGLWDAVLTCFFIDTVNALFLHHGMSLTLLNAGQKYRELPPYNPPDSHSGWHLDQLRYGVDAL